MTRWEISFEVELPTDSYNKVCEWAEHVIGYSCRLRHDNPCVDIDLPAIRASQKVSCPIVSKVE